MKKSLILTIISFVILFVGGTGVFLFMRTQEVVTLPNQVQTTEDASPETITTPVSPFEGISTEKAEKLLVDLKEAVTVDFQEIEDGSFVWKNETSSEDIPGIPVVGRTFHAYSLKTDISEQIDAFFNTQGFVKDPLNEHDAETVSTTGYIKDSLACLVRDAVSDVADSDIGMEVGDHFVDIFCGTLE